MSRTRGTSNSNRRGSSTSRRARRQWLVDAYGNGKTCRCFFPGCRTRLTVDTVTVDRIQLGVDGGSYRRDNIRPACAFHNSSEGSKAMHRRHAARRAAEAIHSAHPTMSAFNQIAEGFLAGIAYAEQHAPGMGARVRAGAIR